MKKPDILSIISIFFILSFTGVAFSNAQESYSLPLPKYQCATKCLGRDSSGNCYDYGDDVCGLSVLCVSRCEVRSRLGDCVSYSKDVCGTMIGCAAKCLGRNSMGQCYSYEADSCQSVSLK